LFADFSFQTENLRFFPKGVAKVLDGMKTAYLALRHRKNKNHKQRIVVFVGSPLDKLVEEREAVSWLRVIICIFLYDSHFQFLKFSKKLKKEKVSVDFVLFGEATSENNRLVGEFVDQLNGRYVLICSDLSAAFLSLNCSRPIFNPKVMAPAPTSLLCRLAM
jgi:hypothetical protein